ncbi:NUDIX domain-containing protein [Aquibaculum sediminis]|uniref:NUDIX domain-containing protein n=1 Tax=Aquibaculum sediminis TaxID=3231907 RepID=UPI0034512569
MIFFGERANGQAYRCRPGAYGLAWRARAGQVLLVETADGLEIPGGGIEPGETAEVALAREFLEETGHRVLRSHALFGLRQYLTRPLSGKYYDKHCTFFAVAVAEVGEPQEAGHRPFWCAPAQARGRMAEECQEWLLECLIDPQQHQFDISRRIVDSLKEEV